MSFNIGEIAENVMKRDGTGNATLVKMFEGATVEFFHQDAFTIAMLRVPVRTLDGVQAVRIVPGVAKRNFVDEPNPRRGKVLALVRAIRRMIAEIDTQS